MLATVATRARVAVPIPRRDCQRRLLPFPHAADAEVPPLDHLASANANLECLFVLRGVKDRAIFESSSVVDQDFLAGLDGGPVLTHLDNLLNHSLVVRQVQLVTYLLLYWAVYHFARVLYFFFFLVFA